MEIRPDHNQPDPLARKRRQDKELGKVAGNSPEPSPPSGTSDQATVVDGDTLDRYVAALKTADPTRLHRVESIKARIEAGTYRADPQELVDPVLDALLEGDAGVA